jgi:hypothetical protein
MSINILCIGDVVGKAGRGVLADHLKGLIEERELALVVCNAENAAGGSGLTPQIFEKLLRYGVDVVTLGDHVYRKRDIVKSLEESDRLVRPCNMPRAAPGRRYTLVPTKDGRHKVAVFCALGQMFMGSSDSPWQAVDDILRQVETETPIRVLDWHAEATSEKIAMGWHLNGRASVVFGTHTHVPTADARVLDKGTAFISDIGMTGPYDGVLGRRKDRVLSHLTTSLPFPFEVATGDPRLSGLVVEVDPSSGKALGVERIEVAGRVQEGGPYDKDDGQPGFYRRRKTTRG